MAGGKQIRARVRAPREHRARGPRLASDDSAAPARRDAEAILVDAGELARAIERVVAAQRELETRPLSDILDVLRRVVESWLEPDSPWRRRAESLLPEACGFSPAMVRFALPWMLEPLRGPALGELLERELGDSAVLDRFVRGRRARGPDLIAHVLSGNLPGLAAIPVATALAIKSAVVVKAASGDRVFPRLWASSIAEADPVLGACAAAVYWRGGDRGCETTAFDAAGLVVAHGSDGAIAELGARCPARFIGHGHRISFAVVSRETLEDRRLADRAAAGLALDVAVWDQRGCLSPQLCFAEGDFVSACRFAEILAVHFERLHTELPPGQASLEEDLAVRRFRDEAEWRTVGTRRALLLTAKQSLDWSVAVEPELRFVPTPLRRSLRVLPFADVGQLCSILRPARHHVEAAGVGAAQTRAAAFGEVLASAGVHRVCTLGRMQRPSLSWAPGGRPRIGDWVTWTTDEL